MACKMKISKAKLRQIIKEELGIARPPTDSGWPDASHPAGRSHPLGKTVPPEEEDQRDPTPEDRLAMQHDHPGGSPLADTELAATVTDFDASLAYPHDYEMEMGVWDSIDQPGKRWAETRLPYRVRGNQYEQPLRFKKVEGGQAKVKDGYIKVEFVPVTNYEKEASRNWPTNTFDISLKALKQVNNAGGDLGSNVDAMYADYIAWAKSKGHITPTASSVMATYFDDKNIEDGVLKRALAAKVALKLRDVEYYQSH